MSENNQNHTSEAAPVERVVSAKIVEIVEQFGLDCPEKNNCGNEGTLSEHGCNGTEEDCMHTCPIPVQCEFCWTNPQSKFNLKLKLGELVRPENPINMKYVNHGNVFGYGDWFTFYCSKCNSQVYGDAKTCEKCGAILLQENKNEKYK